MFETSTRRWTVRDLMKVSIDYLTRKGIDEARLTVELLLSHALEWPRLRLYTHHDLPLAEDELQRFRSLLRRRLSQEPVQYIIGEAHFMGLQFHVDERVLIPRPETETLVEQVILWCKEQETGRVLRLLDIGTGSGNIALSCAKFVKDLHVTCVDNNAGPLDVAWTNAERHGVRDRVVVREWDMTQEVPVELRHSFDIVVSNPPYVPLAEWEHLLPHVRDAEPQRALTDGGDGFHFHRRIVGLAFDLLAVDGPVMLEVGDSQADEVARIMKQAGAMSVLVTEDLSRVPRIVTGHFSKASLQ